MNGALQVYLIGGYLYTRMYSVPLTHFLSHAPLWRLPRHLLSSIHLVSYVGVNECYV